VDIEIIKPRQKSLPKYALTAEEFSRYLALGGDWTAFYRIWTQKEAWSKYTGLGLGKTFHQTSPENELYFQTYDGSDWIATVCGESAPPTQIVWLDP
jgi:phosphopantetheinyl transferase